MGKEETMHGQINFENFLGKLKIDMLRLNTSQVCGISVPQRIFSCLFILTVDEEVGLCLGNILYQKHYL